MHVKFSYDVIDLQGNRIFHKEKIKGINVKNKSEQFFSGYLFSKDHMNKSFRPDGSWCIVWQVEYLDNVSGLKALPYSVNDYQMVKFKHFQIKIYWFKRNNEYWAKFSEMYNDENTADFVVECSDCREFKVNKIIKILWDENPTLNLRRTNWFWRPIRTYFGQCFHTRTQ